MNDDIPIARGDLVEIRELLDIVLHKCIAEDLIKQYCSLGRSNKASPLTNSVENLVQRVAVYLTEPEEEPDEEE